MSDCRSARGYVSTSEATQFAWETLSNQTWIANTLRNIASIQQQTGRYADAMAGYTLSREISEATGDRDGEADGLFGIAQ